MEDIGTDLEVTTSDAKSYESRIVRIQTKPGRTTDVFLGLEIVSRPECGIYLSTSEVKEFGDGVLFTFSSSGVLGEFRGDSVSVALDSSFPVHQYDTVFYGLYSRLEAEGKSVVYIKLDFKESSQLVYDFTLRLLLFFFVRLSLSNSFLDFVVLVDQRPGGEGEKAIREVDTYALAHTFLESKGVVR